MSDEIERCGAGGASLVIEREGQTEERSLTCALPIGHAGNHEDKSGWVEWEDKP